MEWTDREVVAWLEELLPGSRMAEFEQQLRADPHLQRRVAEVIRNRDQGGNTIGEIWQRHRLSCPTRNELGSFLLRTLPADSAEYIEFHLHTVGCRVCQANLQDLEEQSRQSEQPTGRRRRFFESSAGLLKPPEDPGRFY